MTRFKVHFNIMIGKKEIILYKMNCPINRKKDQRKKGISILTGFLGPSRGLGEKHARKRGSNIQGDDQYRMEVKKRSF